MPDRVGRLWRDLPEPERHALRGYMRALVARYGPVFDAVAWEHAKLTVETWWATRAASSSALHEIVSRAHGKGRRPGLPAVDRRMKRAGLQLGSYADMVDRLEALGGAKRDLATALRKHAEGGR